MTRSRASVFLLCGLALAFVPLHPTLASPSAPVAQRVTLDGVIHSDSDASLTFTPDGETVFFDRSEGLHKSIMVSHRRNGHWTSPQIAAFSGHWFDQNPVISPDGSYLLFNSDRPAKLGGEPLKQNYFGNGPAPGANIWRIDRKGDRWGEPVRLSPAINSDVFIDFPSIAADGTLYFQRWDKQTKAMHIWSSAYHKGEYFPAQIVELGDLAIPTHDPAIAADQSFIVFDYGKVVGGLGRLCIALREGDHWGKPIDLGDAINQEIPWGARIASGGHTVHYTGKTGVWQLALDPWLDHVRESKAVMTPDHSAIEAPVVGMDWIQKDDASFAFTPDGKTVFFARKIGTGRAIYSAYRQGERWSEPKLAPFSGHWLDYEPTMAPDGSHLVFVSNRPIATEGRPLDGYWGGKERPGRGGNLWQVDLKHGALSEAVRLPEIVNGSSATYSPALAPDGGIYFTNPDPVTHHTRLYVSHFVGGRFLSPKPVSFTDGVTSDYDPAIALDGSYIIFSSNRPPTPPNKSGVFIACAGVDGWSTPMPLNVYGTEVRLGPDPSILFFTDDEDNRIHQLSLKDWLVANAARSGCLSPAHQRVADQAEHSAEQQ